MAGSGIMPGQFEEHYRHWVQGQEKIIRELAQALQAVDNRHSEHVQSLVQAVHKAVRHYHDCCQVTGTTSSQQSYTLMASPMVSSMEKAFMWMGRQRPSMAFQLLFALMGHQIEAELEENLGLGDEVDGRPASLASLSSLQLTELNNLQTSTITEEDRMDQDLGKLQQSLADEPLILRGEHTRSPAAGSNDSSKAVSHIAGSSVLSQKLTALQELCVQADALRISTFDRVLELLHTPYQKAQYLLASAKLQVALRQLHHNNAPP